MGQFPQNIKTYHKNFSQQVSLKTITINLSSWIFGWYIGLSSRKVNPRKQINRIHIPTNPTLILNSAWLQIDRLKLSKNDPVIFYKRVSIINTSVMDNKFKLRLNLRYLINMKCILNEEVHIRERRRPFKSKTLWNINFTSFCGNCTSNFGEITVFYAVKQCLPKLKNF